MFCFSVFFIFLILFFGIIIGNSALDLGVTIPDGYRRTWQGEGRRPAHWYLTTCFLRVLLPRGTVPVDSEPHIIQPVCRVFLIYDLSPGILRTEWSWRPASKLPRIPAPEPKKIRLEEGTQLMPLFFFLHNLLKWPKKCNWSPPWSRSSLFKWRDTEKENTLAVKQKDFWLTLKICSSWQSAEIFSFSHVKSCRFIMHGTARQTRDRLRNSIHKAETLSLPGMSGYLT